MGFEYEVDPTFKRRLKKKPQSQQEAIMACIEQLVRDPHHPGLHTKRIRAGQGQAVFQARVDGANRLTFHWSGSTIVLRNHCNHDDALRNP